MSAWETCPKLHASQAQHLLDCPEQVARPVHHDAPEHEIADDYERNDHK